MTKGWRISLLWRVGGNHRGLAHGGCITRDMGVIDSAPPSIPQKKQKTTDKTVSRSWRSEADSNRCSSFCRAVPSHSAIRPYYPFGSANIQTFSFFTKFLPFFHRKVKISSLSHAKTSYRELILEHKYTHNTPNICFLKKKRIFTLRKKAKRCTSKILR